MHLAHPVLDVADDPEGVGDLYFVLVAQPTRGTSEAGMGHVERLAEVRVGGLQFEVDLVVEGILHASAERRFSPLYVGNFARQMALRSLWRRSLARAQMGDPGTGSCAWLQGRMSLSECAPKFLRSAAENSVDESVSSKFVNGSRLELSDLRVR